MHEVKQRQLQERGSSMSCVLKSIIHLARSSRWRAERTTSMQSHARLGLQLRDASQILVLTALVSLSLSGCTRTNDATLEDMMTNARPLSTPEGSYLGVAWLGEEYLAFLYAPSSSADWRDHQIALYNMNTGAWQVLPLPTATECTFTSLSLLARLPNGALSFVSSCHVYENGITGTRDTLYEWNQEENTAEVLYQYPPNFATAPYSFAPDMSQMLQEEAVGSGMSNELYLVQLGGAMERLLPSFQRARSPSWSPDGSVIAFVGTEMYPGGDSDAPKEWEQIEGLLRYPWDLYLMDAETRTPRVLLTGVVDARITWLPRGQYLAFEGEYEKREATWLLNADTRQITLLWPHRVTFDWSPDGNQMVVLQRVGRGERWHPAIVDIPQALFDSVS